MGYNYDKEFLGEPFNVDGLITEARGLLGVITADIADDGFFECRAAERDTIKRLCDALEKAEEQNKQLLHEVCKLACESVEREKTLARLEAEVMARLEGRHEADTLD